MVELRQHAATDRRGKRHVFRFDWVHAEIDGESQRVGIVYRRKGGEFMPVVNLTDAELSEVVAGVNEAREAEGLFGPVVGVGPAPSHTERVRQALDEIDEEEFEDG